MGHRILFLLGFSLIGFALFKSHGRHRVVTVTVTEAGLSSVTQTTLPPAKNFRNDIPNVQAVLKKAVAQVNSTSVSGAVVRPSPPAGPLNEKYRDISEESFLEISQAVLDSLPTRQELRKLSASQPHETPLVVIEGGRSIGRIVEIMEHQPEFTVSAAYFFIQCASDPKQITALRALCYRHVEQVSRRLGMNEKKLDGIVPKNISDLANQMPEQM